MASHLSDVETEIENAHTSDIDNVTYGSLDGRFEADETKISNINTSKIAYTDIVDNLDQSNTDKPLSANQGRVIKTMLGGNFSSSNTVATAISTAQTNAQNYSNTNKVDKTDIYNGVDHTADD
jgi:cobyric acid synthase